MLAKKFILLLRYATAYKKILNGTSKILSLENEGKVDKFFSVF
jgi:hypothetical protein